MRGITKQAAAAAMVVLLLAGAACSDDDDEAASSTPTTARGSTVATGSPTTMAGVSVSPTEPPSTMADANESGRSELADGRHFGYWKTFEVGDSRAFGEFDLAYFLTGDEAEKAAEADGEQVENDYYIVNDNPRLRTLIVDGSAEVTVLVEGGGSATRRSNVADFAVERNERSGYWVTIEDGMVTEIEEQYQP